MSCKHPDCENYPMITKKELAMWMEEFSQDKRLPKDVRAIAQDMAIRAGRKLVGKKLPLP